MFARTTFARTTIQVTCCPSNKVPPAKVASICPDKPPFTNNQSIWSQQLGEEERHQVRLKGSKLGEPCPNVRLSQDRLPIEPFARIKSQVRGKGSKLGEPCPKVRLSQDRLPIEPSFSPSLSLRPTLYKCCLAQMSLRANVTLRNCCFAQMSLRANVASRKCGFTQNLLNHFRFTRIKRTSLLWCRKKRFMVQDEKTGAGNLVFRRW